ncbi:hypothetical protein CR194_09855 [Salipaludibacillus keqinensis]|uniref:Uncharacterized protein n=1 Tax=Salipaludibacillus keqinensis TaxID=2045207 RepID=A0A323TGR2_9BACI|nr:hypothetical protein [Salipaludibacillus keqinensis]PYZ93466.1 hypothetical protein CR194_09855 [Salipaludibacillus keqinensis]
MRYRNRVSVLLVMVSVIIFLSSVISGLVFGTVDFDGYTYYYDWPLILLYWFIGLFAAAFLFALAEIIEQFNRLNETLSPDKRDETLPQPTAEEEFTNEDEPSSPTASDHSGSWIFAVCFMIVLVFLIIFSLQ